MKKESFISYTHPALRILELRYDSSFLATGASADGSLDSLDEITNPDFNEDF